MAADGARDLLVRNVRPMGGALSDIVIRAGQIDSISSIQGLPPLRSGPSTRPSPLKGEGEEVDGLGWIALPGLVEAHTHLDKSLLGMPWYRNEVGPRLIDKIGNERAARSALPIDPRPYPR